MHGVQLQPVLKRRQYLRLVHISFRHAGSVQHSLRTSLGLGLCDSPAELVEWLLLGLGLRRLCSCCVPDILAAGVLQRIRLQVLQIWCSR